MNESKSRIDKLRQSANSRLDSSTAGTTVLTAIIILSGILSAVFFWRHSTAVFAGLPPLLATALGLLIGLVPSEGAFFGWKRIRATKQSMTKRQLQASGWGLWAAVGFAVTNVIAIFVTSFADLPLQVQELSSWIAFFALMLPIPVQFILYAQFVVNEQVVEENHLNARLSALMFSAYIAGEEARIGALLEGMEAELSNSLPEYGARVGRENADRALQDGRRDIVGQYYSGPHTVKNAAGQNTYTPADNAPRQPTPPVVPVAYPAPATGQGEPTRGNGPASKSLSTPPDFP